MCITLFKNKLMTKNRLIAIKILCVTKLHKKNLTIKIIYDIF